MSKKFWNLKGFGFLVYLILIEMCWILGTKISEQLLDFMIADGLNFYDIQFADQFYNYAVAGTVLFWGVLIDRFNKRRKQILVMANIIWIISALLLYVVPITFITYLIVQILFGVAFGANGPVLGSYLGDLFKINRRGTLFSVFTIFVYIIKASAIGVTGLLGTVLENWRAPSLIFAVLAVIIIVLFAVKSQEPMLASVEPEFREKISEGFSYERRISFKEVVDVMKIPTNLLFLLQGVTGMIGVTTVTRYMNYWFISEETGMGMNQLSATIILGAGAALGALLGITIAGQWIDKQFSKGHIKKTLYFAIISLFLQVIFYFVLTIILQYPDAIEPSYTGLVAIFQYYPVFYLFIVVFNVCSFFGTPIGTTVGVARTHVNLPEHRGTAAALYDLFDFIGSGIALAIGGLLYSIFESNQLTIAIGSCFWLISGCLWVVILRFIDKDYTRLRNTMKARARNLPQS